jgi:hypothetical protein
MTVLAVAALVLASTMPMLWFAAVLILLVVLVAAWCDTRWMAETAHTTAVTPATLRIADR